MLRLPAGLQQPWASCGRSGQWLMLLFTPSLHGRITPLIGTGLAGAAWLAGDVRLTLAQGAFIHVLQGGGVN